MVFPSKAAAALNRQKLVMKALVLLTVRRTWHKTTTAMVTATPTQTDDARAPKTPPLNSPLRYSHLRTLRTTSGSAVVASISLSPLAIFQNQSK